jgi:hypothetical protein
MVPDFRTLQVVWPKGWMADEFEKAGVAVTRHTGFDVVNQCGPIWWASELAAWSMREGNNTFLTAPNWYDFTSLPPDMLGRRMKPCRLDELVKYDKDFFVKPADIKIVGPNDTGRAMIRNARNWAEDCLAIGVYPETMCLIQDPVVWTEEWRFWFDGTRIVEGSQYQHQGLTWDEWARSDPPAELLDLAVQVGLIIAQPCTIDCGFLDTGQPALVEMNPVWSSGPYTSDFGKIFDAIAASYTYALEGKGRRWIPEPWLLRP